MLRAPLTSRHRRVWRRYSLEMAVDPSRAKGVHPNTLSLPAGVAPRATDSARTPPRLPGAVHRSGDCVACACVLQVPPSFAAERWRAGVDVEGDNSTNLSTVNGPDYEQGLLKWNFPIAGDEGTRPQSSHPPRSRRRARRPARMIVPPRAATATDARRLRCARAPVRTQAPPRRHACRVRRRVPR